jgi:homoserine O-acetyltransferase/O-succinyltransferase
MRASLASSMFIFLYPAAVLAADFPAPKQGEWIAHDFKFHNDEVLPEVRLHYTTIGEPSGAPVVVLHGTGGSAAGMLGSTFAGELFGPGQALDASKCYIVIPDALGHGRSSKPSDGLKAKFPQYNYGDMVDAQYRLLSEGLGIRRATHCSGSVGSLPSF